MHFLHNFTVPLCDTGIIWIALVPILTRDAWPVLFAYS